MKKRLIKRSTDEKEKIETLMQLESKLNLRGEDIVSESTAGIIESIVNYRRFKN